MWEDPQNKDGGKFVLSIPRSYRSEGRTDEYWLYTVLAVIGETMDATGEEVCGCVVSIRKSQDRIALWLRSSDKKKCIEVSFMIIACCLPCKSVNVKNNAVFSAHYFKVGARWKSALQVSNKTGLKYQAHQDGEFLVFSENYFCHSYQLNNYVANYADESRCYWEFISK